MLVGVSHVCTVQKPAAAHPRVLPAAVSPYGSSVDHALFDAAVRQASVVAQYGCCSNAICVLACSLCFILLL